MHLFIFNLYHSPIPFSYRDHYSYVRGLLVANKFDGDGMFFDPKKTLLSKKTYPLSDNNPGMVIVRPKDVDTIERLVHIILLAILVLITVI